MNTTTEPIERSDSQPRQLYLLFFTELWERFGFYTIQTIIILYMTKALPFSDQKANNLYAAFSALLYITPAIGGYIADRYLGFQRAIIIGGVLFLAAYILTASQSPWVFFLGLSILICANGVFKPSVSSIVGELYDVDDPRRDGGFTLFYMGINVGALIPPVIAGAIVLHYGWHAGFLLAALGMAIGMIIFAIGRKSLGAAGGLPLQSPLRKSATSRWGFYVVFALGIAVTVALCNIAFKYPLVTNSLVEIFAVIFLLVILWFLFKEPLAQRKKMIASLILIVISVGFWALYNQTFSSLTLFADRNMTQHMWGIPVDAEAMQFFNPFFIILLSPMLSKMWIKASKNNWKFSIPLKFALGVLFVSLGFILLGITTKFFAHNGLTSPWWLASSYFLQTIGELLLSPIGLAMIIVLTPKHLVGMMMGVWFFSQAAAFAIGGYLANLAAVPEKMPAVQSLPIYQHAFFLLGWMSLILTVISFMCIPFLKRMINSTAS